jgi:membrane protease YdiL (CAAX protease family)
MMGRVRQEKMIWRPAPGWPEAPPGWQPPEGWQPPADWPAAPPDWQFWVPPEPRFPVRSSELTRGDLVLETRLMMIALLAPWIISAVLTLAVHEISHATLTQLPTYDPHQPVANVVLGLISYLPVAAVVPLALLLLARTGQRPADLGLTRARWPDLGVAVGLAAAGLGCEFVLAIPFTQLKNSALVNTAGPLHVPVYYIIFGLSQSLITSVAEETAVSGYLLTRLDQLGWSPWRAFWVSLALRTSYHVYYGLGVVLTLPLGYFLTRSFQKHGKLSRPILAHFLYDSVIFLISIAVH